MNIQIILIVLSFLWQITIQAQNLDGYLLEAAENNPELRAAYTDFEVMVQQAAILGQLPDPILSFGYFIEPIETRVGPQRARLSLLQMFPWFGILKEKHQMAVKLSEAKYQEFIALKNKLYYEIKKAYYNLYEVGAYLRLQKENLDILKVYKSLSTAYFSNNKGSMTDVIRVELLLREVSNDNELLIAKQNPLQTRFRSLLNRTDQQPIEVIYPKNPKPQTSNKNIDSLWQENPLSKANKLRMDAVSAKKKWVKKSGYPQFGVGLDYIFVGEGQSTMPRSHDAYMPKLSVSIPLFRGKYKSALKQTHLEHQSLSAKYEHLKNKWMTDYQTLRYEIYKAYSDYQLYKEQIIQVGLAIKLLYTDYSNLGKDFDDLLRMEQQLINYQKLKVTATKNYYIATAKMDYLISK